MAAPKASCLGAFGKCFVAGTPVLMADGTWESVEKVRAGDSVMTKDAATGRLQAGRVVEPYVRQSDDGTIRLTFSSGLSVETTSEHPFFIEGQGWVEAGKLKAGARVAARDGDKSATLERVERRPGKRLVYNFEVEGTHSYFVGDAKGAKAGGTGAGAKAAVGEGDALWVHNYELFKIPHFDGPIHHIATNKHPLWTPKFEAVFERANVNLNWKYNKVRVDGHYGPHSDIYHQWVLDGIDGATSGLSGVSAQLALRDVLLRAGNVLQGNPHFVYGRFVGKIPPL
jgi:hypothetical protein